MRFLFILLATGLLMGCGNTSGKPLPMLSKNAPSWNLVPDHLDFGALPQ